MKDQAKYLGLVAGLVVLVSGLSGCFTIMTGQAQYRADKAAEFKHFNVPILSDTIFAVGRLDAASAKVLEVPDAVAFLGTKNTYMVLEGGTGLMQAATELDGKRITLTYRSRTLFLKDKTIWGFLTLYYGTEEKQTYSPDEIATLSKLGFVARSSGSFEKKIEVKGLLYPALALSEEQMQRFKVSRQIDLYNPPDSSPPPDFSRTLIVPLAVAADIVTLPIQFIGFTVFVLTLRGPA